MSDNELIGMDPLDWMNKEEVKEVSDSYGKSDSNEESQKKMLVVDLGERFDIRSIESIQNSIKESDQNALEQIQFNAANVKKIDAAALQYLAAFIKHANANLIPATITNINELVKKNIELLGLSAILLS